MLNKRLRFSSLLLSLVALLASVFSYLFTDSGSLSASVDAYLTNVRQRVKNEIQISQRELTEVSDIVLKAPNYAFFNLNKPTTYPYFIYVQDSLVFWSDHRFVPSIDKLKNIKTTELITLDGSKYLVTKKALNFADKPTVCIFSFITLYKHYKNENSYLQSGYNNTIFSTDPQQISDQKIPNYQNINDSKDNFVFSLLPQKADSFRNESTSITTLFLGVIAFLLFGVFIIFQIRDFNQQRRFEWGFLLLAVYLVTLRAGMLYFDIPHVFYNFDLFHSKFYGLSDITPSLGDLLLNATVVLILGLHMADFYYRSKTYFIFANLNTKLTKIVSIVLVVLSYWVFDLFFNALNSIYENSRFTLDITLSISFDSIKIFCLIVFICIATIYFIFVHILGSLFIRFNKQQPWGVALFLIGSLFSVVIALLFNRMPLWLYVLHGVYFWLLYFTRFPRILYSFRYKTSLYFFLGATFCAVVTTYIIYYQEQQKDITAKKEFGEQIASEDNGRTRLLLKEANTEIQKDIEIQENFLSVKDAAYTREQIIRKLKTVHLNRLIDDYDIEIMSFNTDGSALDNLEDAKPLNEYRNQYGQDRYITNNENIFFVNDIKNGFNREYADFIEIKTDSITTIGHVLLVLTLRSQAQSVYPELLKDERIVKLPDTRSYSYALFDSNAKLLYSRGSYNYERKLGTSPLNSRAMYEQGINFNDYKHVGFKANGRKVVVSSPDTGFKNIMSNFSFLFLVLIIYVIIIIGVYAIRYGLSKLTISYTTKIQILLNVAFFLPLLLVAVTTLSVISSNYSVNQESNYLGNTKNIAANFMPYIEEYLNGKSTKAYLEEELNKIARESDTDIDVNFFDTKGKLFLTTRPVVYENGLLSKYLNPSAYIQLLDEKDSETLLDESLGQSQHRTAYVMMKSLSGKPVGVLSIPYFDSKPEIDRQMIEVLTSVLTIFAIMFIIFLLVSYWASNSLTVPLKIFTQRIRKTNLYQLNQPLVWKSDDEIGLMVGAYNQMLTKLEESKTEIAKSEKMSAWQEMARQVAHEIKNPLTPMKLTIQQMQRTLRRDDSPNNPKVLRTMESLIEQIDNISDIATSFSDFAKMPLPKNELFEVTNVLNKAADLYTNQAKLDLSRAIVPEEVWVMGDRQLTGRIITNLIINGIQSVPEGRRPEIMLRLYTQDGAVYIEVRDNGAGIPESIRSKVFFPNFSTKRDGSGLGLAIAKRGIEHAGGTIWFETEENEGTSFFISLPLHIPSH